MIYLNDINIANFARTKGARDKKPRKRRGLYTGLGVVGTGGLLTAGGLALKNKKTEQIKTEVKNNIVSDLEKGLDENLEIIKKTGRGLNRTPSARQLTDIKNVVEKGLGEAELKKDVTSKDVNDLFTPTVKRKLTDNFVETLNRSGRQINPTRIDTRKTIIERNYPELKKAMDSVNTATTKGARRIKQKKVADLIKKIGYKAFTAYLGDISSKRIAEFARPKGARDKQPRKRRITPAALGVGVLGIGGGTALMLRPDANWRWWDKNKSSSDTKPNKRKTNRELIERRKAALTTKHKGVGKEQKLLNELLAKGDKSTRGKRNIRNAQKRIRHILKKAAYKAAFNQGKCYGLFS